MTEALRKFCVLEKELHNLKSKRREATGELAADRKNARQVLLDSLRESGQTTISATVGGQSWCVQLKQVAAPVPVDASIADRVEAAWEQRQSDLRSALEEAADLTATTVDFVLELSRPNIQESPEAAAQQPARSRETLVIRRAPARLAQGEQRPVSANVEELVGAFVENGQRLAVISKEMVENRKVIAEARNEAEKQLMAELEPPEGGVQRHIMQRVTLRDSASGGNENYYLRVKPALKASAGRKKITEASCRRALKKLVDGELKGLNLSGAKAVEHLCSADTGKRICEGLRQTVLKTADASAGEQGAAARAGLRLSLDRVRSSSSRAGGGGVATAAVTRPAAGALEDAPSAQADV